jgi:hypothetical protein
MTDIPKELIPRKFTKEETPREKRASNLEEARSMVMKDYDKLTKAFLKFEKEFETLNEETEKKVNAALKEAAAEAEKSGKPFTWTDRADKESQFAFQKAYAAAYYPLLQKAISGLGVCEPDIDQTDPYIRPGRSIYIYGTCFGPPQGKVLLEIRAGDIVELEVIEWSETGIHAWLNSIIAEVGLRPYYGRVWIQTGNGATSNVWPIMFKPIYSAYFATWTKHVCGGLFGKSKDGTFLNNRRLGDADFEIEWIERHHSGDGWSDKRSPHGGGQDLEQGWHIGVAAFDHATMTLGYRLKGPKNVTPPFVIELGPWGYLGDYW